jgi:hypothetical protein
VQFLWKNVHALEMTLAGHLGPPFFVVSYSITSSARMRNVSGIVSPIAFRGREIDDKIEPHGLFYRDMRRFTPQNPRASRHLHPECLPQSAP